MQSSSRKIAAFKESAGRHGDAIFLTSLLVCFLAAGYIFYLFVYQPLFTPETPPAPQPVFNRDLYTKVLGRFNSQPQTMEQDLAGIPPNPF